MKPDELRRLAIRPPSAGEVWRLKDNGNPFNGNPVDVRVLEIKLGWVRYSYGRFSGGDRSMRIEGFVAIMSMVEDTR